MTGGHDIDDHLNSEADVPSLPVDGIIRTVERPWLVIAFVVSTANALS